MFQIKKQKQKKEEAAEEAEESEAESIIRRKSLVAAEVAVPGG